MPEPNSPEEPVCSTWQWLVQIVMGVFLLVGTGFMAHYYAPPPPDEFRAWFKQQQDQLRTNYTLESQAPVRQASHRQTSQQQNLGGQNSDSQNLDGQALQDQVQKLTLEVNELRQEQAMPSMVLNRYRNSICYIYGVYHVGYEHQLPALRARVSGTGFVVADGLLATNRHVAEPWYGDSEAQGLIQGGAVPHLEKLLAFFPGLPTPVDITPIEFSADGDLAVATIADSQAIHQLRPLPLATQPSNPGELVAVVGYPMGVVGMVAKSPTAIYERLAYRRDDQGAASELAALSLIRPSATYGHLGDVVGDKLIYDAPTAHGGSGGPVFDSRGEVIGVNAAYIDGFSGGTLGVAVQALRPLIDAAQKRAAK